MGTALRGATRGIVSLSGGQIFYALLVRAAGDLRGSLLARGLLSRLGPLIQAKEVIGLLKAHFVCVLCLFERFLLVLLDLNI